MSIYKVIATVAAAGTTTTTTRTRLVEATNKAQAVGHVARDTITAEVCSVPDAMELAKDGVEVEQVAS